MSGTDNTTRIILVRHGHVEGILPERFRGRRDVDLSELGVRQAQATAQRIAGQWTSAIVYTSPLKRCVQTAAAFSEPESVDESVA
jgi:phosphoserine phosphatase